MSNSSSQPQYDPSQDKGLPNQASHAGEAIARQPERFRKDLLAKLEKPNTGTPFVARGLQKYLPSPLLTDGVAVPDDPEEMRWRLFFAHSQDMMGFRADIFTGGPNEADNPYYPNYQGLRDRWPDGKSMLEGLAALWQDPATQKQLIELSHPFRPKESRALGTKPVVELLRGPHGNEATRTFATALDELKGHKIARSSNAIIRAYCQNAALLAPHGYCFRTYLRSVVPDLKFPSDDISVAEARWRKQIEHDFYHVGPALAAYLIADWLFWFWRDGQISWFDSYKADSVWLKSLAKGTSTHEAVLPPAAASPEAFLVYCRTLRLPPEWIPAHLWHLAFYNLPPRVVNEVIWLEEAATGANQLQTVRVPSPPPIAARPGAQEATGWPRTPPVPLFDPAAGETPEPETGDDGEDPDDPDTFVPVNELAGGNVEIKDWYEHKHSPSIFVIFTKEYEAVWCYSGNELRRIYLESPDSFISEPLELPIPDYLDKRLTEHYDNF